MNYLQLKYFQEVAKLEHMTKAAENLNVSQPSLSNSISRLEKSLGVPLFIRQGRKIKLTSFGKVFLQKVNHSFLELEEAEKMLKEMADIDSGIISIATTLPSLLPLLLKEYLTIHPKARMMQKEALSETEIISQLENSEIDLCISTFPIHSPEIEWLPLYTEEIFLSVPSWHRFANRESVELLEVADEPFISITPEYGFRRKTDSLCQEAGFEPDIAFEIAEAGIIQGLVELGLGVTFTPKYAINHYTQPKSVQLHISTPICERTIGIAWHKTHFQSKAVQEFKRFSIEYFRNLD
jgi:DNA-binding transcriptional LysR family regulator